MKTASFVFMALILPKQLLATENSSNSKQNSKILIAYFSHSGNTRFLANEIQNQTGGVLHEIKTVQTYPQDYDSVVDQAKKEQNANFKPELSSTLSNIDKFDTVFIGYPNWWGTIPMALFTFFEKNSFARKTIIPFTTHEGSYFGRSVSDIRLLNPSASVLDGVAIRGRSVRDSSTKREIESLVKEFSLA
ncbi:MAG: flavodoxin [Campylobacteraceae bacterium]